jgi:sugar/nucleoside kinase (ribokinase family)
MQPLINKLLNTFLCPFLMEKYDVVGLGSPLLDFIVEVDDSVVSELGLTKGQMHLVDKEKSIEIIKKLNEYDLKTASGGSSANTTAGVSALGGTSIFIGLAGRDDYGDTYEKNMISDGVEAEIVRNPECSTGHAIVLVTPDTERTFAVHLGAALELRKKHISEETIKKGKILHLEGFLLEGPVKEAAIYAMDIAKQNNIKISLDLSDAALITRNLEEFKRIVSEYADIIFVNEDEAKAFTGREEEEALQIISKICDIAIVKLGEKGSLIKTNEVVYEIPARRVDAINTNGAGDMYAAAILYGISRNIDFDTSGKIASYASSLVVTTDNARLTKSIKEDVEKLIINTEE